jgi:hypothetical protein
LDLGLSPAKILDRGGQLFVPAVRATAVHDTGRAPEAGIVDATGLALIAGGELKDSSKLDGSAAAQVKSFPRLPLTVCRSFSENISTGRSEASA